MTINPLIKAIARKRTTETEREQRTPAEVVCDIAAALNSSLNLEEVLDRILSNVGRVVPHDATNIMLLGRNRTYLTIVRATGYPDLGPTVLALADFPSLRRQLETKQPMVVSGTRTAAGWIDRLPSRWIRSHLGVPIQDHEHVIGLLNLDSAQPDVFTTDHAERLLTFAHQAAAAIKNAQLHEALNDYAQELERRVKERTRQLAEANERLQELDRLREQFVSNVSHELRAPIANVKLHLGLLTRGRPDKYEAYLQTIQHETARLEKMMEDLLDLSRLDRGATAMVLMPMDVNQIATLLIIDRALLARERGLRLEHHLQSDLPLALANPLGVEQVLANLLANAMNYTPPGGGINVTTAMADWEGHPWVTVTVGDTGPGISARDLPHLFQRFYRGEAGRRSGAPGTGLGLAICHEIITRLGGRITVDSQPDEGARFRVWLKQAETSERVAPA